MCIVSNVHDYFEPKIPWVDPAPAPQWPPQTVITLPDPSASIRELNALIHEFKRLLANAKELDEVTGQPDCVDPEKAKLQDRVAELEKLLANPPEFVIAHGGKLEPGRYKVIDGQLYKLVDSAP